MKYLPLYYTWINSGCLPHWGLCQSIGREQIEIFSPTGDEELDSWYWGYNGSPIWGMKSNDKRRTEFTPLRQTIVLLLAAMNNEL